MELPPVRFLLAGILATCLVVFTGSLAFSYTVRARPAPGPVAEAAESPAPPAPLAVKPTTSPPVSRAATPTLPSPAKVAVSRAPEPTLIGVFAWPLQAPISSYFGPRGDRPHEGIDFAANYGVPIKAARDGEVITAGYVSGYGYTVILRHADRTRTLYGHASRLLVQTGQKVRQGQPVALVGSTGHSTGPHLHFEILVNDQPRDPLIYLPKVR